MPDLTHLRVELSALTLVRSDQISADAVTDISAPLAASAIVIAPVPFPMDGRGTVFVFVRFQLSNGSCNVVVNGYKLVDGGLVLVGPLGAVETITAGTQREDTGLKFCGLEPAIYPAGGFEVVDVRLLSVTNPGTGIDVRLLVT